MADKPKMLERIHNAGLLIIATAAIVLLAEPLLRMRYVEPEPDRPTVRQVQQWLVSDADVGFTWKHDVSPELGVHFDNADIQAPPLCTDEFGVINAPEAIQQRHGGSRVAVLGLGDSFMEMAAPDFHRLFAERGLMYYSLAVHRYAPPQYARMFAAHGMKMRPEMVLVGLFENDFAESADFQNWQASGLDWFTFHSGTWCGPPVAVSPVGRLLDEGFAGYQGLARVIRSRVRGERMSVTGPTDAQIEVVVDELSRLAADVDRHGGAMWLMLIPSKPTARGEPTAESRAFDRVVEAIATGPARVIDLRPEFQSRPDPVSLYYEQDGHWNPAGVRLAAEVFLNRLTAASDESRSD